MNRLRLWWSQIRPRIPPLNVSQRLIEQLLLLLITGIIYLPSLGDRPLQIWDESIYAAASQNILTNGHWLIPHLYRPMPEFTAFLDKPPLVLWLQAGSMSVLGMSTFAVRLPSVLAFAGIIIICYRFATELYGERAGLASGVLLMCSPRLLSANHSPRTAVTDIVFVFFGTLFVYLTWRSLRGDTSLKYAVVAAVGAVLSKGLAAAVFLVILAPILVDRWQMLFNKENARLIAAGMVAIAIWPVIATLSFGDAFIQQFLIEQVLNRVTDGVAQGPEPLLPWFDYAYFKLELQPYFGFLFPVMIGAVAIGLVRTALMGDDSWFVVWWFLAVPLTFGTLGGDLFWYLHPMMPAAAILMGGILAWVSRRLSSVTRGNMRVPYPHFVLIALLLPATAGIAYTPVDSTGASGQETIGQRADTVMPSNEPLYIDENLTGGFFYPIDFYTEGRTLTLTSPSDSSDVQYALVPNSRESEYPANERLATGTIRIFAPEYNEVEVTLIRVE